MKLHSAITHNVLRNVVVGWLTFPPRIREGLGSNVGRGIQAILTGDFLEIFQYLQANARIVYYFH
jgi:hypothetical protein